MNIYKIIKKGYREGDIEVLYNYNKRTLDYYYKNEFKKSVYFSFDYTDLDFDKQLQKFKIEYIKDDLTLLNFTDYKIESTDKISTDIYLNMKIVYFDKNKNKHKIILNIIQDDFLISLHLDIYNNNKNLEINKMKIETRMIIFNFIDSEIIEKILKFVYNNIEKTR